MMKDSGVNYIIHLNTVLKYFQFDERLTLQHIGFYMLLFQKWNSCGFRNPISVYRDDLMSSGQIGSRTTYLKILKHLTKCGYIIYIPSKNPMIASKVYMFKFCTSPVLVVGPYINYINILNNNYNKGKIWIEERNKHNKDGASGEYTCSKFEQVLYQSQIQLLSELKLKVNNETSQRSRYQKKSAKLRPTGHQPSHNADYSEPL